MRPPPVTSSWRSALFRGGDEAPDPGADEPTDDREHDEHPELLPAPARPKTTVAKLRAGFTDVLSIGIVTMWISASMSPIGMPVKPASADLRVVPAITRMNSAVNTTSVMTTAQNPNFDGE